MLKSVKIKIFYDSDVKKITEKDSEEIIVSENMNFVLFLRIIITSYPEILTKFPPGILGFLLNGRVPNEFDILKEGDAVLFVTAKNKYFNS